MITAGQARENTRQNKITQQQADKMNLWSISDALSDGNIWWFRD